MARIKIEDLPENAEIGKEDLQRIRGGSINPYLPVALDGKGSDRPLFTVISLLSRSKYIG